MEQQAKAASDGVIVGLMLSLFIAALDATVVSTAMPKIAAALSGFDRYTWPFTSYLLTCTIATLLCGGIAARVGHKKMFMLGILVFAGASLGCALSNSIEALTAMRAVQGVGGGFVESGVFITVAELFEPRERGKYMGAISSMYGLASVAGPLVGGLIADTVGWHWIFLVNLPISIVALVLVTKLLPGKSAHSESRLDLRGAVLASATVVPLVLAFSLTGDLFAWWSAPFFGLLIAAALFGALLVAAEKGRERPIVPVRLFARKQVSAAFVLSFGAQFLLLAGIMFIPRFAQEALGLSSTESAYATIPMTLALIIGSNASGRLFGKTGRMRMLARIAFIVMGAGSLALGIIGAETNLAQIAVSSAVLGFGIGMSMPLGNIAAQTGAEPHNIGKATSMALFFRGLGGTIGTAACGAAVGASSVGAAPAVFGICIALAATCLVTMVWLPKMIEGRRGARGRAHAADGANGARDANGDASVRITDISCERPATQGAEGEIASGNPRPKPASPNVVP